MPSGVQASYALGAALLVSTPDRLRVCRKCGAFFYDVGKRGKAREYGTDAHASAARQRRYRENLFKS